MDETEAMVASDNQRTFEAADVVRFYAAADALQKPEQTILELLGGALAGMRMLDIGVGGGRTTRHFAPAVKEYVGVDYAAKMVDACVAKHGSLANARFEVANACALGGFEDRSFDFVLFSYNGIDYLGAEDRLRALREIRRVARPGAPFAFSTHNLHNLDALFSIGRPSGPIDLVERAIKQVRLRLANPPRAVLRERGQTLVNDGSYRFRATTYYITPRAQLAQLEELGFHDTKAFRVSTGDRLDDAALDTIDEPWVYFLCST